MIRPPLLKPGDKVGMVAPARKVTYQDIQASLEYLRSWGLEVILAHNLFKQSHSYLAATDEERLSDFQSMVENTEIKAIFCARGGYGSTRILDRLDFHSLLQNPKWIVGFSDVTAIHLKLNRMGIESIHGTMPLLFSKADAKSSIDSLWSVLFRAEASLIADKNTFNIPGVAQGKVVGGNLSLLVDSLGTSTEPNTAGGILLIEEIDEPYYKIDRMLRQLKRASKFKNIVGLAVGYMTDIKETEVPFGETIEELILNVIDDLTIPVAFNVPTGHENPNLAWIHGGMAQLEVSPLGSTLTFQDTTDLT